MDCGCNSQRQSRLDDLRTALRVDLQIDFYVSRWLPGLDITFRPRLAYNFYEYETRGGKNLVVVSSG